MPSTPKIVPADPQLWRKAFLDLRPSVVPCPGFTPQSWGGAHEACVDFLDRWADQAMALGWTTLECLAQTTKAPEPKLWGHVDEGG